MMKLLIFILLPLFLSAQTVDDNIDSIVKSALDEKLIPLEQLMVKIDSIVRAVHSEQVAEEPTEEPVDTKGFVWVDVNNNVLGRVGGAITLPSHATIQTFGVGGPVTFKLAGPINTTKEEGQSPYNLFGDIGVRPTVRLFPKGNYELTASYAGGSMGVNFRVD